MKKMLAATLVLASACTYAQLSPTGSEVRVVVQAPQESCKNLGPVIGEGGGGGGGFVRNDALMEHALNDARNKAAAMGATHLQTNGPQLGSGGHTTISATVMGVAFRCGA